jgi:hypothetical protein
LTQLKGPRSNSLSGMAAMSVLFRLGLG